MDIVSKCPTLLYPTLPYPTLPYRQSYQATSSLLQDSAFGTLCLAAIWTSHHVHFRLLNLLACHIPPPPPTGQFPFTKIAMFGGFPRTF